MTMRIVVVIIAIMIWASGLHSQTILPPLCGPNAAMESFCRDACIICDIDGFTGRNNSTIQGQAPPGFCTSQIHHMQWISFIAGSTNLKLSITVSNCSKNEGLELGLYKSNNCTSFTRVTECDTDIQPGTVRIFSNTVPLEIGQHYFIVMDGSNNDVCDWTFKVLEGSTKVGEIKGTPSINLPPIICLNESYDISTNPLTGASDYLWQVDENIVNTGEKIKYTFATPGKHTICMTPRNACLTGDKFCREVDVLPIPKTTLVEQLCADECYTWFGAELCTSGKYNKVLESHLGCDSIVELDLTISAKVIENREITICSDDTLTIGTYVLNKAGDYVLTLLQPDGCEMTINLVLKTFDCAINTDVRADSLNCPNDRTGEINLKVTNGVVPIAYTITLIENPSIQFIGQINALNSTININKLSSGYYQIYLIDKDGRESFEVIYVAEPNKLKMEVTALEYNGYNISCFGQKDGNLKLNVVGGTPSYRYTINGTTYTDTDISNLTAGRYLIETRDKYGCIIRDSIILKEPQKLEVELTTVSPGCDGPMTGALSLLSAKNVVGTLAYVVNGKKEDLPLEKLGEGQYQIIMRDDNECTDTIFTSMVAARIPEVTITPDTIDGILGECYNIQSYVNLDSLDIQWTPSEGLSCVDCLDPTLLLIRDHNHKVIVTSLDGCIDSAIVRSKVTIKRSFVMANIVNVKSTVGNDKVRYHTGKDVSAFIDFGLYDRWGNLIFKDNNLPLGLESLRWDLLFNANQLNSGVYSWIARVSYIDGQILTHKGMITIIQ
jgi:hypothetical protein